MWIILGLGPRPPKLRLWLYLWGGWDIRNGTRFLGGGGDISEMSWAAAEVAVEAAWSAAEGPPRRLRGAAAGARWCRRGGIGSHDAPRDVLVRLPDAAGP